MGEASSKQKTDNTLQEQNSKSNVNAFHERDPGIIAHLLVEALQNKFGEWTVPQAKQLVVFLKEKGYSLTSEILGFGGFGMVFKSYSHQLNKYVAIKAIKFNSTQQFLNNMQEFNHQKKLSHPNILQALEIHNLNELQMQFIIMEMCQYDLNSHLKMFSSQGRWLNREFILNLWRQLIDGLIYLHKNEILHLDIKSGNVLLGNDNKWKYTDFGLSHLLSEGQTFAIKQLGLTKTTCSPEQYFHNFLNQDQTISKESDIYSLGVLFLCTTQVSLNKNKLIKLKLQEIEINQILNPKYSDFNSELIEPMMRPNPVSRISLEEVKNTVNKLIQMELDSMKLSAFKSRSVPKPILTIPINTCCSEDDEDDIDEKQEQGKSSRRKVVKILPRKKEPIQIQSAKYIQIPNFEQNSEEKLNSNFTNSNNSNRNNPVPQVLSSFKKFSRNRKRDSVKEEEFQNPSFIQKDQKPTNSSQDQNLSINISMFTPNVPKKLPQIIPDYNFKVSTPQKTRHLRLEEESYKFVNKSNNNCNTSNNIIDSDKKQIPKSTRSINLSPDVSSAYQRMNSEESQSNFIPQFSSLRNVKLKRVDVEEVEVSQFSSRRAIVSKKLPPPPPPSEIFASLNEHQEKQTDLMRLFKPKERYDLFAKNQLSTNQSLPIFQARSEKVILNDYDQYAMNNDNQHRSLRGKIKYDEQYNSNNTLKSNSSFLPQIYSSSSFISKKQPYFGLPLLTNQNQYQ